RLRAAAIAKVSLVAFAGFLVAPVLMGVTSGAFGLRAAFGLVAAICLFVLPLTAMLARRGA
ncbi:MAG: MFS transporter, partial [Paracoccaceae bacterium]